MEDNNIPIFKVSITGSTAPIIGQGSFGKVYALDKDNVYKKIRVLAETENDFAIIENNVRELAFYRLIMGKNTFTNSFILENMPSSIPIPNKIVYIHPYVCINMPNYGTPLSKLTYNKTTFKHIFKQIIEAIYHLYRNNMSHGDLKPNNILIDSNNNVKLIDYGSVCFFHSKYIKNEYQRCTIFYVSPEELISGKYSKENDWWSLGVIMFEFCTHKCFIKSLLDYYNMNKNDTNKFMDYGYDARDDFDSKEFIITFFQNLENANINRFITSVVKDKELQLYLILLLKVRPDERNFLEIIKLFECDIPEIKRIKVVSGLTKFEDYDILSLSKKSRFNAITAICTTSYQVKEFGEEIIGHSIMLFDRFFMRSIESADIYDPKIYTVISLFISSSILKGELFKGSYIQGILSLIYNKEYSIEDIKQYLISFFRVLDFSFFCMSPDILFNFTRSYDRLIELSVEYPFINDNIYQLYKLLK